MESYNDRFKSHQMSGMVTHVCNSITPEAEAGGLQIPGQPGLHRETLYQKKKITY
jgi:hypothetical protein